MGAKSINYVGGIGFVANSPSKKTFETMQSTNNFGLGFSRTEQQIRKSLGAAIN